MVVSWFPVHLSGAAVMGMQQNSPPFNVHILGICLNDEFFHCEGLKTSRLSEFCALFLSFEALTVMSVKTVMFWCVVA
jgi:hypothetical protein